MHLWRSHFRQFDNIKFAGESLIPSKSNVENESDFDWNKVGGERVLLEALVNMSFDLPITSYQLLNALLQKHSTYISHSSVVNLLNKFAAQNLIQLVVLFVHCKFAYHKYF